MPEPTLTLTTPAGPEMKEPALPVLEELVLRGGPDFWAVGSGDGMLTRKAGDKAAALILMLSETAGFHLRHQPDVDELEYFVPVVGDDFTTTVELSVGGNRMKLPKAVFVSRAEAWDAVREFARTGGRTKALTWKNLYDLDWDWE
jgi:hypothetical protein